MTTLSEHFGFVPDYYTAYLRMSHGVRAKVCGQCGLHDDQLKMCSMCRAAWYCNEEHQRQHWSQHKPFCVPKSSGMRMSSGGGGGGGGMGMDVGVAAVGGGNNTGAKNRKKGKKKSQETNFNIDKAVLDEVAASQQYHHLHHQAVAMAHSEIPFQGGGGHGRGRRKSPMPDLSTPIGSSHHPLEASMQACQSNTPPLCHVTDSTDTQSLEEGGFSQEWFCSVLQLVMQDLNKYGVCVVDDFLGTERADRILGEVKDLHSLGLFQAGQVVSRHVQDQARGKIRGDKIAWVTGSEPNCTAIGQLVSVVDSLVAKANKHQDAGKLAQYNITWRTRAMVACYPGQDTHYVKHVDNPNGDGRCITAIYYLNKHWTAEDGGVLRIYPENYSDKIAAIEPCFDRMLFFWSDRRNPHEVMPAKMTRFAITVWYLDQKEREEYLARESKHAEGHT